MITTRDNHTLTPTYRHHILINRHLVILRGGLVIILILRGFLVIILSPQAISFKSGKMRG